jgi:hypothetical protein
VWPSNALVVASILLPVACVAVALALHDRAMEQFLVLYVAPLLVAGPLWVRSRLGGLRQYSMSAHVLDALVLAISVIRVFGDLVPFSGHMLFLVYSAVTTPLRWYRVMAALLIILTTVFKFAVLKDPLSWSLGLVVGIVAALLHRRLVNRHAGPPLATAG